MMMKDKSGTVIILRTLSIMLLVLAFGMIAARMVYGLDISLTLVIGLITIAAANLVIARNTSKDAGTRE